MDISAFNGFDESNSDFMDTVAETLSKKVTSGLFKDQLIVPTSSGTTSVLDLNVKPVHKLKSKVLNSCLTLVDQNLSHHYVRTNGKDWKLEKKDEMMQDGLVYVYYTDKDSGNIVAFLLFMLTYYDPELKSEKVLYLFEIHVSKNYQTLGIGAGLIEGFHTVAKKLGSLDDDDLLFADATCLTVFSDNLKALKWYKSLLYGFTEDSPRDKVLRNKRVVKPPYYILIRPI